MWNSLTEEDRIQFSTPEAIDKEVESLTSRKDALDKAAKELSDRAWKLREYKRHLTTKENVKHLRLPNGDLSPGWSVGDTIIYGSPGNLRTAELIVPTKHGWVLNKPPYSSDLFLLAESGGELKLFHLRWNHIYEHGNKPSEIIKKLGSECRKEIDEQHVKALNLDRNFPVEYKLDNFDYETLQWKG